MGHGMCSPLPGIHLSAAGSCQSSIHPSSLCRYGSRVLWYLGTWAPSKDARLACRRSIVNNNKPEVVNNSAHFLGFKAFNDRS